MPNNPFSTFFGPTPIPLVRLLKNKPEWLVDIAARMKRFMLAEVHEAGPSPNPHLASEISGAFSALQDRQMLPGYVAEYLASPNPVEPLRRQLRDLKRQLGGYEETLAAKDKQIRRLEQEVLAAKPAEKGSLSWLWFASLAVTRIADIDSLPEAYFPRGSIPRGVLYRFRVIVKDRTGYTAYEFDIAGRVILSVKSSSFERVRLAHIFRSDRHNNKKEHFEVTRDSDYTLVGCLIDSDNLPLSEAVKAGTVKPYFAVGMRPVFVLNRSYAAISSGLLDYRIEARIVEILPLQETRDLLMGSPKKARRPGLLQRIREYKKAKKMEESKK